MSLAQEFNPGILIRMRILQRTFLAVLLGVPAFSLIAEKAPPTQNYTKLEGCTYIPQQWNDGDSFHVRSADGKEFIFRLYFVDTPESENSFPERVAEQAAYFGITSDESLNIGKDAAAFTAQKLKGTFTVYTRWRDALGRSQLKRFYAFIKVGPDYLQDLLVKKGLARIYGTRTPLPDGTDSRQYLASLKTFEDQAEATNLGAWHLKHLIPMK